MRILQVLTYYHPYVSGLSIYAQRLGVALASRGHEVSVVAYRHASDLPSRETLDGVEVYRVMPQLRLTKGVFGAGFMPAVMRHARSADVTIFHLPFLEAGWLGRRLPSSRLMAVYHCDFVLRDRWWHPPIEALVRCSASRALRRSGRVVASSRGYAEASPLLRDVLDKLQAIPPPIHDQDFQRVDATALRRRWMIPMQGPVVGFLGRFVSEKGLPILLEAIPKVIQQVPDVSFILAGEREEVAGGTVTDRLQASLQDLGDRVKLPGCVASEQLAQFYSMLSCLVLPSVSAMESFGMVQVEAMCCETPVVASDLPGVRDVITRVGGGRLARPGDSEALARAIIEVLHHPKDYHVDRRRVLDAFGFDQTLQRFETLLDEVLHTADVRPS